MRIGVTISRDWDDYGAIWDTLVEYKNTGATLVHGASQMDWWVAAIAWALGMDTEPHPAGWTRHGKGAGFIRNQEMVDSGADKWLAFIKNGSSGATDCANRAERAGIPVTYVRRLQLPVTAPAP